MFRQDYHPGVCNIGKDELNKRKRNLFFWITGLISITALLLFSDMEIFFSMVIIFVLASITSVSMLQVSNQFCVFFGFIGKYNFHKIGFGDKITQPDFRIADRRKAMMILVQAILFATVYMAVFYFVKRIYFSE